MKSFYGAGVALALGAMLVGTSMAKTGIAENAQIKPGIYDAKTGKFDQANLRALIGQMSAEEKAKILSGVGMSIVDNIGASDGRVPGSGGQTHAIERLGIPDIVVSDGPSGVRILNERENDPKRYETTGFPVETVIGASWNPRLAYAHGRAVGAEAKEYGIDIWLAPGVNIQRNPLNGRNFEYLSEDPVLSGVLGAEIIKGAQSLDIGTSLKHYAANNAETNRAYSNSLVSERALREVYLRPFELAVKAAQPWTIMTSYNKLNNVYTSERKDLNKQLLREEWGFEGTVMTDWFSAFSSKEQLVDPAFVNEVSAQVRSGNDLIMPGMDRQLAALTQDIESGELSTADADFAVENILKLVFKSPAAQRYSFSEAPDLKAHATLARAIAAEGAVLLRNEGALPMRLEGTTIAPFGVASYHLITGGTGSSEVTSAYRVSIVDGLKNAKAQLYQPIYDKYQPYVAQKAREDEERRAKLTKLDPFADIAELDISDEEILQAAKNSDIGLLAIGRNSAEEHDLKLETDYHLRDAERSLLERVSDAFHREGKKLVLVLNVPSAIDTSWAEKTDAILVSWYGGQEGGNAVADVLGGAVNPSAKLTQTFPKKYSDVPSADSFFGQPKNNPTDISYTEGIYVGYRYFDRFNVEPAYPFGFGLSYTDFDYSDLQLESAQFQDKMAISVKVTNKGKVAGMESVQLYLQAPSGSIDKPVKELKGFAKTELLQPGQSEVLTMLLDAKALASFHTTPSQWIADQGEYTVFIGRSSRDLPLKANFTLADTRVVEHVQAAFTESLPFKDLVPQ